MDAPMVPVVVLGATGMVGQRVVERLAGHPWMRVVAVAASDRRVGQRYGAACRWVLPGAPPEDVASLPLLPNDVDAIVEAVGSGSIVLSALPKEAALEVERPLAARGLRVVSNASAHRQDPDLALVIPEVNADHLGVIDRGGLPLVTNPNCTVTGAAMALAPLHAAVGVEAVCLSSWQAISGAGYPGLAAWDILGNVHPHAGDEEEKVAAELPRLLGSFDGAAIVPASIAVSARCVRVPVVDGHLVSIQFRTRENLSVGDARELLLGWRGAAPHLPSSPARLVVLDDRRDRPQPRLDADAYGGMSVTIGRVERCPVMGLKLFALTHNTQRGAAGAAVLNAELLIATGRLG